MWRSRVGIYIFGAHNQFLIVNPILRQHARKDVLEQYVLYHVAIRLLLHLTERIIVNCIPF